MPTPDLGRLAAALPHGRSLPEPLWRSRHWALVLLLAAHALLLPVWAAAWGHPLEHAAEGSLALAALSFLGAVTTRRAVASASVSVGLVAAAALVVHTGGGHTFLHFHFFVVVAALALYQDWEPFGIAIGMVLVEHGVLAKHSPREVYDDPWSQAHPFAATLFHAGFVLTAATATIVNWRWSERERVAAVERADAQSQRVRDSERRLAELIDHSPALIFVAGLDGRLQRVNARFSEAHGRGTDELEGALLRDVLQVSEDEPLAAALEAALQTRSPVELETEVAFRAGGKTMHLTVFPLLDEGGTPYAVAGQATDVSWRVHTEQQLRFQSQHDDLTGLPNRRRLMALAEQSLDDQHLVGLAFFDLDGFKEVNDSLGHDVGDALLQSVAKRLLRSCPSSDVLFRLGGDEFVLLMPDLTAEHEAAQHASELLAALDDPVSLQGQVIEVRGSSGVAVGDRASGTTIRTLLRDADTALYEAKDRNRGSVVVFDPSLRVRDERRRRIQSDLRRALRESDDLRLCFQPITRSTNAVTEMVEALLRWEHPVEGPLSPLDFLPAAAHAGMLPALDRWVIRRACAQWREWADAGRGTVIALNITPETVGQGDLVEWVRSSCATYGMPPSSLVVELTETAVIRHRRSASRVLSQLRDLGVRIALDDFGTGYSSLSLLRDLPVDIVKVDRSFVNGLLANPSDAVIVQATVDLAHALSLVTVAEGIESAAELNAACHVGADLVQGWHIARPLEAEQVLPWILSRTIPAARRVPAVEPAVTQLP